MPRLKNLNLTLKTNPLKRSDLDEFVTCYHPENRHERQPSWSPETPNGRWRCYDYEEILKRDKLSLDLFWIKDQSLTDTNLDTPDSSIVMP